MNLFIDLNLWTLGIVLNVMLILGLVVLHRHHYNITNIVFAFFALVNALWGIVNYLPFYLTSPSSILFSLRATLFFAVWQTFLFILLASVFPRATFRFPVWVKFGALPLVFLVSLFTLTQYVFSDVLLSSSQPPRPIVGPGMVIFALAAVSMVGGGIIVLTRKLRKAEGVEKIQLRYLLIGVGLMFSSIIGLNFLLPVLLTNTSLVIFAPLFVLPFVIATTYAITKHHLFDIRLIATEILTALLILISFFRIVFSNTPQDLLVNGGVFLGLTFFGILLIRSVLLEIKQKEQLRVAYAKLEELDRSKSEFVSIASHQLRTPLTAMKGYISMILEGSYGKLDTKQKQPVESIYESNERLIRLVNDLLNVSRIESGKVEMKWEQGSVEEIIKSVVEELRIKTKEKNVELVFEEPESSLPLVRVDKEKVRNVVLNVIDNAIRYTPKGNIVVNAKSPAFAKASAGRQMSNLLISVKDTGEGMTQEEMGKLFQTFSRGGAGMRFSTEGAGLGLYIAKKFVEMHKGRIWVESQGKGQGSTFYVELPVKQEI